MERRTSTVRDWPIGALIAVLLACASTAAQGQTVPEPTGYRTDHYRSPVPATLQGARVIDAAEAEVLAKAGAVMIDVTPQAPKPAGLPKTTVWRMPKRETIAGAVWLANVGYGDLNPDFEAYFRRHLGRLTGGDMGKPLVFFCLRDCWMSWNAAKRALEWGHRSVVWFPDGTDGWKDFGLTTEEVLPAE